MLKRFELNDDTTLNYSIINGFFTDRPIHADEQEPPAGEPGKNTLKMAPCPAWLSTSIDP